MTMTISRRRFTDVLPFPFPAGVARNLPGPKAECHMLARLRTPSALAIAWAFLVFAFAAWVRPHMMVGLINDEAIELLQGRDLPTDHFYYFAPSYLGAR